MSQPSTPSVAAPRSFAALRNPGYRAFFLSNATAMMADSIEHVISYWVIFQKFHSPALGGFAIISHWVPFLLFSVHAGALADRFDPRRLIQIGMVLFMCVSLAWGVLFVTDTLQEWHARVLLVIHGCAGVLWSPTSQVLIHDIVSRDELPSAVRMNATARYLGLLAGPAVGGIIMLVMGPTYGIFCNALLYLPTILWLWKAPYGPRFRKGAPPPPRPIRGFSDIFDTLRSIRGNPTLISMILLAGCTSLLIGTAYQAQMPGFANDLGHGRADLSYSLLLGADAAGALVGAFVLESTGWLRPRATSAFLLVILWCCALTAFAFVHIYALALALLFIAGFVELSFNSTAQTLVQLNAPEAIRGRVIGVYSMSALGLRTFSGFTIGIVGAMIGIHQSLVLSAAILLVVTIVLALALRPARPHVRS